MSRNCLLLGMRLIRFIFAYFLKMSLHADIRQFVFRVSDLRFLFDNPENAFEDFDVEYRDNEYFFQPHESASVGEERLPLTGYRMPENEHESVVVHIPVSDRNLLKDLVRKFGWACVF